MLKDQSTASLKQRPSGHIEDDENFIVDTLNVVYDNDDNKFNFVGF